MVVFQERLVGGVGDEKEVDDDVKGVVASLSDSIKTAAFTSLTQSGENADATKFKNSSIDVLSYKTQVVAGLNYFVKVRIDGKIFHLRIYKHFSGSLELSKVAGPKPESDPIAYFQ